MDDFLHGMDWVLPLRSEAATAVFQAFTALGYFPFYLLALPLAYWLWDRGAATRLVVLIMLSAILNGLLKDVFDDPRPAIEYALDGKVGDSYGLPSGHAQLAFAAWGWLAMELRTRWGWVLAAVVIAGICFSRLYLGVHDVEDVLAGSVIGLLSLVLYAAAQPPRFAAWYALASHTRILVAAVVLVPLFLLWPEPDGPGGLEVVPAFLLGWYVGTRLDERHGPTERHAAWPRALLAAAIGIGLVFGLFALPATPLTSLGVPESLVALLRTALLGLLVTALAPWGFRRLGLAA